MPGGPVAIVRSLLSPNAATGCSFARRAHPDASPPVELARDRCRGNGPCLTGADQRGVKRPQGARCDIGAFERS